MSTRFALLLLALPALAQHPLSYELHLRIDPRSANFTGTTTIELALPHAARSLRLHALGLSISRVLVDQREAKAKTVPEEQIEIEFPSVLAPGKHQVKISYTAPLSDTEKLGVTRRQSEAGDWYAFTTFTPIEARRAFPCFDEPRFKTPFRYTIEIPEGMTAATNTPLESESSAGAGWKRLRFATSQALPTEVVAFTVGPWEVAQGVASGSKKTPTRILYPRNLPGSPAAALQATPEILARLEAYTGIPYPWEKLDQIALLANAYGAVENPGLITYRSQTLLAKDDGIRAMRGTMSHELAHQWFGNLVTQASWKDVFLSEGFATWLGNRIADLDLPEAERGTRSTTQRNNMLARDASAKSRAVRVEKSLRTDMTDVYGPEVYQKAGSILRMMEGWLGEETMQRGLRLYLKRHAGGTATEADLVAALQEVSRLDVAPVLDSYLNRTGVPRLHAVLRCDTPQPKLDVEMAEGWTTPVCIRTPAGRACQVVRGKASIALADASCPAWLIPNAGGTGYYRTAVTGASSQTAPLTANEKLALEDDAKSMQ
ncbi:M1 family metallopeptidase [Bryobacter aggregatus]|uniref:M1 family metallopeptidase n=1 Tax=Bryobacter aggregatus TaxID=360054 RepID=UPI00068C6340|nr:M1 family metallopeptidase [Bryobacter aggregatus]